MDELDVFKGETVLLKGPGGKVTTCIVLSDDFTTDENITMNQTIRNNLGVELGDVVSIQLPVNITYARRVLVLPVDERIRLTTNVLEAYLKPYFLEAYRPVHQGDIFIATDGNQPVEFMVVETDPPPYGIVAPDTILDGVRLYFMFPIPTVFVNFLES